MMWSSNLIGIPIHLFVTNCLKCPFILNCSWIARVFKNLFCFSLCRYSFPMELQRMLPIVILIGQQPVALECFGSILCLRNTLKSVSAVKIILKLSYTQFMPIIIVMFLGNKYCILILYGYSPIWILNWFVFVLYFQNWLGAEKAYGFQIA